ncbi:protein-S-isoprenylcysteine methyltransferase [Vespertiliibacter pulmonis]|uniref:Protein-S-isoprenylcysteine O-methyltransferase Ste14 n=1 Tax=Vespertiliibacter pulmonis TaxID=1443036 RepID=A0A3N4VKG4_9PAST|nr:isoprenylcysteine carboxylmethyltransferase family protein [Vespertiliibacter pulmonis]QLB20916.1 protein-S-isoprenylcysteine methyltransferase [Vespertiliibacter pulmonis]RPE83572.1 protein-S-isoprenylcysteine O-methyltransferase Ste14 [Vespertiliibacter pulmonis]
MAIKIPPPILFLLFSVIIFIFPNITQPTIFYRFLAVIFAIFGIAVSFLGIVAFHQKRTTVDPLDLNKTTELVIHGIYRFTRNPMYIGLACLLITLALWLGNVLALVNVWFFGCILTKFQIIPEEKILMQKFGKRFTHYQQRVPRWLWR